MQTPKEAALAILRGEKADFIPEANSTVRDIVFPGERYIELGDKFDPYGTGPDAWGVLWTNMGPEPGFDGNMVAKNFRLFDCMEDWKEYVKIPDLKEIHAAEMLKSMADGMGVDPKRDCVSVLILSGVFERMNQMIGMEEALCSFYDYPDEVKEFFEAVCDYKLRCIELAHEVLHPDVIHMHDDWGTNNNMFFSPEIWREFIKPIEKKYVDKIHSLGMLYVHHSCGYITQIIGDLAEIGVDGLEPVMVKNDVVGIMRQYGNRITVMGGLDNQLIDGPGTTEEQIRAEVRRAFSTYAHLGRYMPSYIATNKERYMIYLDECNKCSAEYAAEN